MQHKTQLFITLLFASLMLTSINAQNYQISFTGSGLSTNVDSVQVLNLARGTSVTVKSTEGLQLVGATTDIENHLSEKGSLGIFPNPMTETSGIEFFNFRESPVNIEVFDIAGKMVISNKQNLMQGHHRFEISGLKPGIYMVNLLNCDGKYTGKLISNGAHVCHPAIQYQGNTYSSAQMSVLKSTKNLVQMPYNDGERLLFKSFSGNYSRVSTLIPTQNQAVNFEYITCADVAGKHYPVVTIGDQTWMAENLAYLPSVVGPTTGSQTTPYYYVYGYNGTSVTDAKTTSGYKTYGVLYNFPAALQACPVGWHLPTYVEWRTLQNYLMASGYNYDGTNTGNKIAKSIATASGWASFTATGVIGNADYPEKRNATGFSALPGGRRDNFSIGSFLYSGYYGFWWSSTGYSNTDAFSRHTSYGDIHLKEEGHHKRFGFSVRCLRD